MNDETFQYKTRFITFILLLGYAYLHFQFTGLYTDTPLEKVIDFSVRLPFAQRLLVPAIAHFIAYLLPINIDAIFFLVDWLFISLFFLALYWLLRIEFEPRLAQLLSWLFILLLPLITIINYRFIVGGKAAYFFPCDNPSMLFIAVGMILCLKAQWRWFIPLVFFATLNRESSILLVLLIPTLYWRQPKTIIWPTIAAALAYILARLLIMLFVQGLPGPWLEWYNIAAYTHFVMNFYWLFADKNMGILVVMFCFAGMPLFWFAFYDYIPLLYRPIRYLCLFYFIGLSGVGIFYEARVFHEIVVLLYLPVCAGVNRWFNNLAPIVLENKTLIYYINRYAILFILTIIVACQQPLNLVIIWLSHHV